MERYVLDEKEEEVKEVEEPCIPTAAWNLIQREIERDADTRHSNMRKVPYRS